jgi:hypothetical protein
MNKFVVGIVIATTIYMVFIFALIISPVEKASIYIDDISVFADGNLVHFIDFSDINQTRVAIGYYGTTSPQTQIGVGLIAKYSEVEYYSPPRSICIPRNSSNGIALFIKDQPFTDWSELKVSFMTKISGVSPSRIYLWIDSDDGYYGSSAHIGLGEKDFLSGKCIWDAYAAYYSGSPPTNHNWDDTGSLNWDWSSWHKVEFTISRPDSTLVISLDSNVLRSVAFEHIYGDNLMVELGY